MIPCNPLGVVNQFPYLCDALVEYKDPPAELEEMFRNLLTSYKHSVGEKWLDYLESFPSDLKEQLKGRFGL